MPGAGDGFGQDLLVSILLAFLLAELRRLSDSLCESLQIRHVPELDMRLGTGDDSSLDQSRIKCLANLLSNHKHSPWQLESIPTTMRSGKVVPDVDLRRTCWNSFSSLKARPWPPLAD